MPTFVARLQTPNGYETVTLTSDDRAGAERLASARGNVVSIKRRYGFGVKNALSKADRAIFLQRLSSMVGSRMGVSESLKLISETFSGKIGNIAGEIKKLVDDGEDLVDAMGSMGPAAFPVSTMAIMRVGAQGGDLAKALADAVAFEQELNAVKSESARGLWSAFIGFISGVIALLGTTLYIVPEMEKSPMVQQLGGGQLVWVTLTADIMTWISIFVAIFVFIYLMVTKVAWLIKPAEVDRLLVHIPYVRDINLARKNHLAFYGLGVLMAAGLRIEEALSIARNGAPRGQLREDFTNAVEAVRQGNPWPNAIKSLHPTDRAALATSQDRMQIAESMQAIAQQYKNIYKVRIEQVVPTCQLLAAFFLTASGVVLFGAVILPMLEMTRVAMTAF